MDSRVERLLLLIECEARAAAHDARAYDPFFPFAAELQLGRSAGLKRAAELIRLELGQSRSRGRVS